MVDLYMSMISVLSVASGIYFYSYNSFFGVVLLLIGVAGIILSTAGGFGNE